MDTELMSKILEYYISSLPNGTIVKKQLKVIYIIIIDKALRGSVMKILFH